jgi:transposase
MRIIGCDLHARQQTLAMLDTGTGEVVNRTLPHEGNSVREFYSKLPGPVRVGIEATGSMKWFLHLMEELGIDCQVGHPATIRAAESRRQKHDRRDAELLLKLLVENRFPSIWQPSKELLDLRALLLPSSVGTTADPDTERAAGDCTGEWFTAGEFAVERKRARSDRLVTPGNAHRSSAQ